MVENEKKRKEMQLQVLILAVLLPLITFLFLSLSRRRSSKPKNGGGGDPSSFLELIKNGHRLVDWTAELLEASPTGTVATYMGVFTADPAAVEHIAKARFEIYVKGDHTTTTLRDFLGEGIFNSDGGHWKFQRRIASIEFTTKTIRTFVMSNVQHEVADRLLPLLSSAAASGRTFDLQELLERFAFDNVCKVVFNEDLDRLGDDCEESRKFYEAFEEAGNLCSDRFRTLPAFLWKLKRLLNVGSERRLKDKIAFVHRFAKKVIEKRRESLGDDLISRFISDNGGCSDEFLRDIITSFVLAGRDTTSATLTWFFWLMGRLPHVKDRVMVEIRHVRSRSGGLNPFTLEQVKEMEYLHAALSETLRLYPPVPLEGRTCSEDDVLPDGTKVKKGTTVMYNSYAMGRSKRLWGEDCEEFRPERWLDESGRFQPRSPYEYPVFHAGPRMCLGKDMAYIQMKVVAATVMERFDVVAAEPKKERETVLVLIMKMKGGLMVRVTERVQ